MSDFSVEASEVFPGVIWNGRSKIHVSIFIDKVIPGKTPREALIQAYKDNLGAQVWATLVQHFPTFEWLLTQDDFEARCYVDLFRHSKGKGDTQDPTKLKNPYTGSVFHRVALYKNYVGGIRFWFTDVVGQQHFGFRFRIQKLDESELKLRKKVTDQAKSDKEELKEVLEVLDIKEPPPKQTGVTIKEKAQ